MPENATPAAASPPSQQVARLMDGYLTTQVLYVAVKLGIAEVLAAGPSDAELASAVQALPAALRRILRGLAGRGSWRSTRTGASA